MSPRERTTHIGRSALTRVARHPIGFVGANAAVCRPAGEGKRLDHERHETARKTRKARLPFRGFRSFSSFRGPNAWHQNGKTDDWRPVRTLSEVRFQWLAIMRNGIAPMSRDAHVDGPSLVLGVNMRYTHWLKCSSMGGNRCAKSPWPWSRCNPNWAK